MKKLLILILIFCIQKSFAQNDTNAIDNYYIDFSPPDLSAFQLLGNSSSEISRPSSLKELTTGIMAFNNKGSIAPGVALEWSPGYTIKGRNPNLFDYRKKYKWYAIQVTAATASDSTGTNTAFGLKWTPINNGDILRDKLFGKQIQIALNNSDDSLRITVIRLQKELGAYLINDLKIPREDPRYLTTLNLFPIGIVSTLSKINKATIKPLVMDSIPTFSEKELDYFINFYNEIVDFSQKTLHDIETKIKSIKDKWLQEHWNSSVFLLSAGIKMNSPDSRWDGLKGQKIVACINYAYPLGKVAQNIWQVKNNYYVSGDTINKNEFYVGTRLLIGNQSTRFSIEGSYNNYTSKISSRNDEKLKVTVGLEFKLSDGLWFEIAGGIDQSVKTGSKPTSIGSGNFKYALQKKRRF